MTPFEALYGRRCRSPIGWFDAFEVRPWGTNLLWESLNKFKLIEDRLLMAQSRQKSYADRKVRDLEFTVGDRVLLKVLSRLVNLGRDISRNWCGIVVPLFVVALASLLSNQRNLSPSPHGLILLLCISREP
ncbi:hypothetical protein MTR67_024276 [Solanum verrucosum]|uniref:Uncharacterized protein n=1 Tax=Solanum verrucosum TaxID=315347 RepID=A0AAF0TSI2_SOLVR|nr:hypothetical protein MTR67_024276 [Solanum verrucosum]